MIARDRGKELSRCLQNVRQHVDELIVVDAGGSTDDTVEVAKRYGAKVFDFNPQTHPEAFYLDEESRFAKYDIPGPFTGRHALADFSAPRNLSFSKCSMDYILWLDSDDTVRHPEKLRWMAEMLEANPDVHSAFLGYEYDHDEKGNCTIRQVRERMIPRADFESGKVKWQQSIHEHLDGIKKGLLFEEVVVIHESPVIQEIVTETNGLKIQSNHRDNVRFRNIKNLLIEKERLEALGEELPWRLHFYLGTETRSVNPEAAIEHFQSYLPKSPWAEERAMARYYMGQIREMQQQTEEAWNIYAGATVDFPGNPAPWFGLARLAFIKGDWAQVIKFTENGFDNVKEDIAKKPSLVLNPHEWRYRAHLPYSRALIEVGRISDAKESCDKGLSVNPNCPYLTIHAQMVAERLDGSVSNSSSPSKEVAA